MDESGIQLKGGYSADNHFLAATKLLTMLAKVPSNSGEYIRIATICQKTYERGMSVDDVTAFLDQMGGVREAYEALVAPRRDQIPLPPVAEMDSGLRLEIHSDAGFQGILNVTSALVAKMIRKWGVVGPVMDGGGDKYAGEDNIITPFRLPVDLILG